MRDDAGLPLDELVAAARMEYANSAALRAEFTDADCYVAYCKAASAGRVRICGDARPQREHATRDDAGLPLDELVAAARMEYANSAALRAEFTDADCYVAYCKAVSAGRVRIFGNARPQREHATAAASSTAPGSDRLPSSRAIASAQLPAGTLLAPCIMGVKTRPAPRLP